MYVNIGFIHLFSGAKVTFSGYKSGGWGNRRRQGTTSDAHRFAVLLSQLYQGRHAKSVQASVINVLARNRQVCLRMPKFKDTRSERQGRVFNGWTTDRYVYERIDLAW